MTKLDRTIPPLFKEISDIAVIKAKKESLDNGIPLYFINAGTQAVNRIEVIFNAGSWFEKKMLTAQFANAMMQEGTSKYNYQEISEKFDYYGVFFQMMTEKHKAMAVMHSLNKHLSDTIPLLENVIKDPIFPKREFEILVEKNKQQHLVSLQKVSYLSRKLFTKAIYGDSHPYGKSLIATDFDAINLENTKDFYQKHYHAGNCEIILSGNIGKKQIDLINKHFGNKDWKAQTSEKEDDISPQASKGQTIHHEKEGSVQSAICIGKRLINRSHPEYVAMQVLVTALGGYFGSRLMRNLREDKGYTYGIGAYLMSLPKEGTLMVFTEVNKDATDPAVEEIMKEIRLLRTELIGDEELILVKTQMLGEMISSLNGPFALAEAFRQVHDYGLDYSYFDHFVKTVKNISPEDLLELAEKYLQEDSLYTITAGSK